MQSWGCQIRAADKGCGFLTFVSFLELSFCKEQVNCPRCNLIILTFSRALRHYHRSFPRRMMTLRPPACPAPLIVCILAFGSCGGEHKPAPGKVLDEARQANRAAGTFPAADEDYFHDMDGALPLSADEIKGRNTWIVWTGGNDRF